MRIGVNKVISFTVNGQNLKRTDNRTLVNKSHNVIICKFKFQQKTWNDVPRFVIFKDENDAYNIPLDDGSSVECTVPWEVLNGNWFKLTLYGGDLITTNQVTVHLEESGYTTDISPTREHTKDSFVDVYEKLDAKAEKVHTHDVEDISNLESILDDVATIEDLDGKSDVGHTHLSRDITDLDDSMSVDVKQALNTLVNSIRTYGE